MSLPFRYKVLDITDGIDDLGGIKWDLLGTFVLCWIITFFCVFRGMLINLHVQPYFLCQMKANFNIQKFLLLFHYTNTFKKSCFSLL